MSTLLATEVRNLDRGWDVRGAWAVSFVGANTLALEIHPTNASANLTTKYVPDPSFTGGMMPNRVTNDIGDQIPSCREPTYSLQRQMPCRTVTYLASATPQRTSRRGVCRIPVRTHVFPVE